MTDLDNAHAENFAIGLVKVKWSYNVMRDLDHVEERHYRYWLLRSGTRPDWQQTLSSYKVSKVHVLQSPLAAPAGVYEKRLWINALDRYVVRLLVERLDPIPEWLNLRLRQSFFG